MRIAAWRACLQERTDAYHVARRRALTAKAAWAAAGRPSNRLLLAREDAVADAVMARHDLRSARAALRRLRAKPNLAAGDARAIDRLLER